jgi:ATP-dependent Clp protease adaptor protein ClpS
MIFNSDDTDWEATGNNNGNLDIVIDRTPLKQKKKLAPPPKYAVVMLNDDFTPVDFVVAILMELFNKTSEEAIAITMDVHKKGKGVAGIYTKDIAESKTLHTNKVSQDNEFPFKCQVEPA